MYSRLLFLQENGLCFTAKSSSSIWLSDACIEAIEAEANIWNNIALGLNPEEQKTSKHCT